MTYNSGRSEDSANAAGLNFGLTCFFLLCQTSPPVTLVSPKLTIPLPTTLFNVNNAVPLQVVRIKSPAVTVLNSTIQLDFAKESLAIGTTSAHCASIDTHGRLKKTAWKTVTKTVARKA